MSRHESDEEVVETGEGSCNVWMRSERFRSASIVADYAGHRSQLAPKFQGTLKVYRRFP